MLTVASPIQASACCSTALYQPEPASRVRAAGLSCQGLNRACRLPAFQVPGFSRVFRKHSRPQPWHAWFPSDQMYRMGAKCDMLAITMKDKLRFLQFGIQKQTWAISVTLYVASQRRGDDSKKKEKLPKEEKGFDGLARVDLSIPIVGCRVGRASANNTASHPTAERGPWLLLLWSTDIPQRYDDAVQARVPDYPRIEFLDPLPCHLDGRYPLPVSGVISWTAKLNTSKDEAWFRVPLRP